MGKILLLIAAALAVTLVTLASLQVGAAPTDQSQNLIRNGMFEGGWVSWGSDLVGQYWTPFAQIGDPQYGSNGFEPGQQLYSPGSAFTAGLYQTVDNAVPGYRYYSFVGTAAKWGAMDSGRHDGHIGRTIGVDPYGGTNPSSPNVIWGSQVWDDAHWNWKDDPNANAPKVWVTAMSNRMTLFLKVIYTEANNPATVWLADAAIMLDTSAPPPTPTPTPRPVLNTSSTSLRFLAESSGGLANSQTLVLTDSNGGSQLGWSVTPAHSWLTTNSTSGSSVPRNLTVSVNTTGLSSGSRTSRLIFDNTSNSSQPDVVVDVSLYIGPLTRIRLPLAFR